MSIQTAEIRKVYIVKNGEDNEITRSVYNIIIEENISNKLLNGSVTFNDEFKIFTLYGFSADEKIKIILYDNLNDKEREYTFSYVTHFINSPPGSQSQEITIQFTETVYLNFIKEYSTSLNNKPISTFIEDFSKNVLGKTIDIVEQSKGKYTLAFPYQKFHFILSYLNQYLQSISGHTNYFYFSTLNATFFTTLENRLKLPQEYMIFQEVQKNLSGIDLGLTSFTDYKIEQIPNIQQTLLEKQGSSKVQYYDYNTGKIIEKKYSYSDIIKNTPILGKYSTFSKSIMDTDYYTYYASTPNVKNDMMIKQGLFNGGAYIYSLKNMLGDLRRTVGSTCKVLFREKNIGDEQYELSNSGIYLISKITHIFMRNDYKQNMVIIKNGANYPTSEGQSLSNKGIL